MTQVKHEASATLLWLTFLIRQHLGKLQIKTEYFDNLLRVSLYSNVCFSFKLQSCKISGHLMASGKQLPCEKYNLNYLTY